jgi:plastocyanin
MKPTRNAWIVLCLLTTLAACLAASEKDKHAVTISKMKFSPATITIKTGETVVWKNNDDHNHSVIAEDDSFKSENLANGDTFSHAFDKAGKYPYSCSYHPRMKGEVIVK